MSRTDKTDPAGDRRPDLERLLVLEGGFQIPEARRDLVSRTLLRIQHWVVIGDLLRFATFATQWKALALRRKEARESRDSEDS